MAAEIQITNGLLPQPACYSNEQERSDAYAAALIATLVGGIQWTASSVAPADLDSYWLKLDSDGNPLQAFKWSVDAGAWLPFNDASVYFGTTTGAANMYSVTIANYAYAALTQAVFFIKFNVANTGASTLTLNSFAAGNLKVGTADLWSGAVEADKWYTVVYDGTNYQVLGIKQISASDIIAGTDGQTLRTRSSAAVWETDNFSGTAVSIPSAGSAVTWAHGFSSEPTMYQVCLVNIATDAGYSTGDRVDVDAATSNGGTNWGSSWCNATEIGFVFDSGTSGPYVSAKSGGASTPIDTGKWQINGYATR